MVRGFLGEDGTEGAVWGGASCGSRGAGSVTGAGCFGEGAAKGSAEEDVSRVGADEGGVSAPETASCGSDGVSSGKVGCVVQPQRSAPAKRKAAPMMMAVLFRRRRWWPASRASRSSAAEA